MLNKNSIFFGTLLSLLIGNFTFSAEYQRAFDFNIGAGITVPQKGDMQRETGGLTTGRLGLSMERSLGALSNKIFWNAGIFLSRKGMNVGDPDSREHWTFTMAETHFNLLYLIKTQARMRYSAGLSLIPIYNLQFHMQSPGGSLSFPDEINPFQFDGGIFARIELGPLAVKPYFQYNVTHPVEFAEFNLHQYGFEIILPLYRSLHD